MKAKKLADLLPPEPPQIVLDETLYILRLIDIDFPRDPIVDAFEMLAKVFAGKYPGYRACNTGYHDLNHTTDAFLAVIRMIHGALLQGEEFSQPQIILTAIATLFHDVGYIQEETDTNGTGAKHSLTHVQRSMDFLSRHGAELKLSEIEIQEGRDMILCTDLQEDIDRIPFTSFRNELLGRMVNAADLLAQLASRTYLEKLAFLYQELKEADAIPYEDALDLIKMTREFYKLIDKRLSKVHKRIDRYFKAHFALRWQIPKNLYQEAIARQKIFLSKALADPQFNPASHFKRQLMLNNFWKDLE
jgi:hypothetical protein